MTSQHVFDEKGKVNAKPTQEPAEPQKDRSPLTLAQIQRQLDAETLTQMQQTMGNTAVQRFLAQRSAEGAAEIDEETTTSIQGQLGKGHHLDENVAAKAGQAMGQDFGDVKIHTDSQASKLSRQLGATAFTTGNDVFFREGAYEPQSEKGQHLIAHELTHVVQQGASPPSVQGKMKVNEPDDQYEAEANQVADMVMNHEEESVQRQEEEEEEIMMQEEEEELMMQEEEEEELMMQPIEEEEEEMQP